MENRSDGCLNELNLDIILEHAAPLQSTAPPSNSSNSARRTECGWRPLVPRDREASRRLKRWAMARACWERARIIRTASTRQRVESTREAYSTLTISKSCAKCETLRYRRSRMLHFLPPRDTCRTLHETACPPAQPAITCKTERSLNSTTIALPESILTLPTMRRGMTVPVEVAAGLRRRMGSRGRIRSAAGGPARREPPRTAPWG